MATFNKFYSFSAAVPNKVHNLASDSLVIALCAAANAPVNTNTQLSNLTQISYTNLSSRAITTTSSTQTTGTYKLILADLTLTASGGSVAAFRYVVIYNDTATNDELIGYYDLGADLTLASGASLLIDFDGSAGVLTIGP